MSTAYVSLGISVFSACSGFTGLWFGTSIKRKMAKLRAEFDAHREECATVPGRDGKGRFVRHRPVTVEPASPTPADTHLAGLVQHQHDGGS